MVQVGQDVRRGEQIGAVGTSGRVTAPHLHYEVRIAGTPMNPMKYLNNASAFRPPVNHETFPF
jgi:murein DD-endopeptidase MepM/ murein hydrolase activator NlpD